MKDTELFPGATSTLRRRLYAKVVKGTRSQCWRWTGKTELARGGARRPAMTIGTRRTVRIARLLLALRDRVPLEQRNDAGLHAGHICGNYWCVNVRHLKWQTPSENEKMKHEHRRRAAFEQDVEDLATAV